MDEPTFLRALRENPGNEEILASYLEWLEGNGDQRTKYFHFMRERARIEKELSEIDRELHRASFDERDWLDVVFPLQIRSETVGRCYLKPSPDSPSYVNVGDRVNPETVVCMVEAMKLFSEITAGVHGFITEIRVKTGDPVEFNQTLFCLSRSHPDCW